MTAIDGNGNPPAAENLAHNPDFTLCECDLNALREMVLELEASHAIIVRKSPSVCLTMITAEDSLERQKFYLGEALTTECEVEVDGMAGFGLCIGDEPTRAYCIAVVDALLYGGKPAEPAVEAFLREHSEIVRRRDQDEFDLILQTQVDFKLMEEA